MKKETCDKKAKELHEKIKSTNPRFKNKIAEMQREEKRLKNLSKKKAEEMKMHSYKNTPSNSYKEKEVSKTYLEQNLNALEKRIDELNFNPNEDEISKLWNEYNEIEDRLDEMNKTEEEKNIWKQMEQLQTQLEEVIEDDRKCKQVQKKIEKLYDRLDEIEEEKNK